MKKSEFKLKPRDIKVKEFSKKVFGYNPDEVDDFLMEVANEFQNLLTKIELLKSDTAEAKKDKILREVEIELKKKLHDINEEKRKLEMEKIDIEREIENLKIVQRKISNKLKFTIIEMTKLLEGIRIDDKLNKEGEQSDIGSESATEGEKKQFS